MEEIIKYNKTLDLSIIGTKLWVGFVGKECEIIKYENSKKVTVKFLDGNISMYYSVVLRNGNFINKNNKFFGVGFVGVGIYNTKTHPKIFSRWRGMLARGCCEKTKQEQPTYKYVKVDKNWYDFQNFAKWYIENIIYEDHQLDKDLFSEKFDKIYSPDTCCFLPKEINIALISENSNNIFNDSFIGVRGTKSGSYRVKCSVGKNEKRISKNFLDLYEAIEFYKISKVNYIRSLAEKYKDVLPEKTFNALLNWKL